MYILLLTLSFSFAVSPPSRLLLFTLLSSCRLQRSPRLRINCCNWSNPRTLAMIGWWSSQTQDGLVCLPTTSSPHPPPHISSYECLPDISWQGRSKYIPQIRHFDVWHKDKNRIFVLTLSVHFCWQEMLSVRGLESPSPMKFAFVKGQSVHPTYGWGQLCSSVQSF